MLIYTIIALYQNYSMTTCAAVSLGCVGDLTGSDVAMGFASLAIVVAVGVALTIFAMAEDFAHPLLDEDFKTLLRAFGPPLMLEMTDCPLFALGFNRPVSMRSLASEKYV